MIISASMNLGQLKERMTQDYHISDERAAAMRDQLVAKFDGEDTRNIPENDWIRMMQESGC